MLLADESLEYEEQIVRRLQEDCKRVLLSTLAKISTTPGETFGCTFGLDDQ